MTEEFERFDVEAHDSDSWQLAEQLLQVDSSTVSERLTRVTVVTGLAVVDTARVAGVSL